jgi:hypothetical protein
MAPLFTPLVIGKSSGIVLAIWTTAWDQIPQPTSVSLPSPTVATLLSLTCLGGMLIVWGVGRRLEKRADAIQPQTPTGKFLWGLALAMLVLTWLFVYGVLAFAALTFATLRYA